MIKANEIRVGNWVKGIAMGLNHKIDLHFFGELRDDETMLDWYNPIPLTPEILTKCGFEKHVWNNRSTKGEEYKLKLGDDGFELFFGWYDSATKWTDAKLTGNGGYDEGGEKDIRQLCKFIHQLQNLYFALTGKELEIKL